jgi:hypothetical protein
MEEEEEEEEEAKDHGVDRTPYFNAKNERE